MKIYYSLFEQLIITNETIYLSYIIMHHQQWQIADQIQNQIFIFLVRLQLIQIVLKMNEEDSNQFLVEVQKLMTSQIASTLWAANMDLLSLTTFDNLIQLYRISYKAQRVFQSDQGKPIKSMVFSQDSQLLAYGMNDGIIKIVKTQNGERVVIVDTVHSTEIQTLTFINYQSLDSTDFLPFQKNSMQSRLILNICPHKNCNKNAIIKINYFNQMKKDFSLLLSSEKEKTLLLLNGFIPLAEIDYSKLGLSDANILYSHFDGKIRSILSQQTQKSNILWMVQYDASIININNEHLIKFNSLLSYISEILLFVEVAYDQAELISRDILRQYNSKINLIDDPNVQNLNPCDELFKFLNCGITSTAVVNFFTKEVYDTKILQKLDQTLNGCFAQLHDLLLQSIQNSLEKATILLKRLQNFAEVQQISALSLQSSKLKDIQQKIIRLYTMGQVLLVESTEAKFDIRNLLVWLNKSTIKSSGENEVEIQNTKSYLNKYTVDFNRLYSFLSSQPKFKLNNLLSFFSKTNQNHHLKLQQPDFRLLSASSQKVQSPEEKDMFNKLAKLFQVEENPSPSVQKMDVQQSFRSFKIQIKQLNAYLRNTARMPLQTVSKLLNQKKTITKIGEVQTSQLFTFEIKPILKDENLLIYYVQRQQNLDRLVEYNCHSKQKKSLTSTQSHILSIAVAQKVIAVLQNKLSVQKIVGQIINESMNGGQIEIGRRISRAQGELDIDSSFRGLNSLVIDKNKLIIFD